MTQKLACETLEDPAESELYRMLEQGLNDQLSDNLGIDSVNWSLPVILEECSRVSDPLILCHIWRTVVHFSVKVHRS